ncbi:S-methyl-5'-thioadenosine phosphorylase [Vibrio aerogenes CECT 7868]|uniref:Purine nucleoside phosphorylase n=1 Tax=Vibrio aerogenes CECT 7868 TaxID=1216006 RepID=A0A1M5XCC0_9VIBR|nr:S-methyl-5'-thioadenosine phosphorylase [Vibrio aerogenes]SHH97426.1 S-methyl-5'-thioadenosine phosphorylase [Vibrio aerogenes CECT 7868]
MTQIKIGMIGGSGLYEMKGLEDTTEHALDTPYGTPSDKILTGTLAGVPVAFLARHGRGHRLLPGEVPYRANIHALKQLGVKYLLSFSAVGSLQEEMAPLDLVIPDQYIDMTKKRASTFFGDGIVAHVSMAQPVCPGLAGLLSQAVKQAAPEAALHQGGTYLCIEGPQFSSLAESNWYRSMNASVIGMTNMPEAKLALEAQMAYASLAMVTDYDCWHPREANVTTELAIANLMKNAERAQTIAARVIALIQTNMPESAAHSVLNHSLVTPPETMNPEQRQLVELLMA